jgi:hypothetical protein
MAIIPPGTPLLHQAKIFNALALNLWKCRWRNKALEYARKAVACASNFPKFKQNLELIEKSR